MVEISHRERVVRAKIIYYGPAAGGKTTNLVVLHRCADPKRRGEMVSVNSTQDRTILLDLLPMKTPAFRGYDLRFQVIAVPGQRMYAASRKLLLNGADAVVFVANSAADRWEETIQSLREMNQNLLTHGLDPATIPVTLQYNKRDLPEVTPMEVMERTLNARRTASFSAVAIREEGVLETFAAALKQTMEDITTRFKLGANTRNARSIEEWTAESMRAMFEWSPVADNDLMSAASGATAPSTSREAKNPSTASPPATPQQHTRVAVKVPVARSIEGGSSPSAATPASDPQAAEALVDSYAQAAADLTTALEDMRDRRELSEQRAKDLVAPFDAAQSLLRGSPSDDVLRTLLMRIAESLGAVSSSLSLVKENELRPVILLGLQREPPFSTVDGSGRPLAMGLLESAKPLVFALGDPGPLGDVLEKSGGKLTSIVAIPIRTPEATVGLACFYLAPESASPHPEAIDHLDRLGNGIALVIELAAGRIARERLGLSERMALTGRVSEQAILEIGPPLDRLFATLGRVRAQQNVPDSFLNELKGMGMELSCAKRYRDAVLGLMVGQPPAMELVPLANVFHGVRVWTADSLERHAVRLETTQPSPGDRVRTDAFLLRSALAALVERSENDFAGHSGGLIRLSSRIDNGRAYIQIADNVAAIRNSRNGAEDYVAWTLNRNSRGWPLSFVANVVAYSHGQWTNSATEHGNELTMILSAQ